jgi:hypothetical protein
VAFGGVNNERRQAFAAILEKEPFGGVGPAELEKYKCDDCTLGVPPLAYVVFPGSELSHLMAGTPSVADINLHPGWLSVNVTQCGWPADRASVAAMTAYELGPGLTPIRWGYTSDYSWVYDRLFDEGRVAERFDPSTARLLVPLQMWDGERFRDQRASHLPGPGAGDR